MFIALLLASPALAENDQSINQQGNTTHPYQTTRFFTTVADGSTRHTRRFSNREDVYVHALSAHRIQASRRKDRNYVPHYTDGWQDGDYVFQVTEPAGHILLSSDQAKCRIIRIEDGAIKALRKPDSAGILVDRTANDDCNTKHATDGLSDTSDHHDTNHDLLGRASAITVQLMPYEITPDRQGYYRLWVIPWNTYKDSGGDIAALPQPICRASTHSSNCSKSQTAIGFAPDKGFSDELKTRSLLFNIKGTTLHASDTQRRTKVARFHNGNR